MTSTVIIDREVWQTTTVILDSGVADPHGASLPVTVILSPQQAVTVIFQDTQGPSAPQRPTIAFYVDGTLVANERLTRFISTLEFTLAAASCRASAGVAATASSVVTIKRNGSVVGSVTFGIGSSTGVVSLTSSNVSVGDYLELFAPALSDVTLADVAITLTGAA